ncbi:folylpolyglutamate synthase/dihydrofolate synthase family protein [Helicobacter marmotae]|nr:bifunctional folylpolyglutamate synthase/dihydrofolate synthase [Helicobacter marmotae]
MRMLSLEEVLASKGAEYAPFDRGRMGRIYAQIAPVYGFNEYLTHTCKVIHIMGTNGKGSTGRFVSMGLAQNHKSVLHFSSPHLLSFNERYYISREDYQGDIHSAELESAHQRLWSIESVHEASYFEYATLLAFVLARDYEYLVLEAGVGGEYDSTSVIGANVSVYTPIGLDHQDMLGQSVQEIALTKLRAMSGYTLIAKQIHKEVIPLAQSIAQERGIVCEMITDISQDSDFSDDIEAFREYVLAYHLPSFLRANLYSAMRILLYLGMKFVFQGLGGLSLRGRCEALNAHIMLDVGHNIDGARVLSEHFGTKKVYLVYNSYFQKDMEAILYVLLPIIKQVLIISVENPRICPKQRLINILQKLAIPYKDFDINQIKADRDYLVFGSFSVVETFLQQYKGIECKIN